MDCVPRRKGSVTRLARHVGKAEGGRKKKKKKKKKSTRATTKNEEPLVSRENTNLSPVTVRWEGRRGKARKKWRENGENARGRMEGLSSGRSVLARNTKRPREGEIFYPRQRDRSGAEKKTSDERGER